MSQIAPAKTTCSWRAPDAQEECAEERYNKTRYCVFHYPNNDKELAFRKALRGRLKEERYDFQGFWFPYEVDFSNRQFNADANFNDATFIAKAVFSSAHFAAQANFARAIFDDRAEFNGTVFDASVNFNATSFGAPTTFEGAIFGTEGNSIEEMKAKKEEADFTAATFGGRVIFDSARFVEPASFNAATFKATSGFHDAIFGEYVGFTGATFHNRTNFGSTQFRKRVKFGLTNFKDYVSFKGTSDKQVFGTEAWLDLRGVKIDKPELVSFHSLSLRPYWFVDVNASRFAMTNVKWCTSTACKKLDIRQEISELKRKGNELKVKGDELEEKSKGIEWPERLLAIACWNLAVNAEENHRYSEASEFRYMAMDVRRLEHWRGFPFWRLSWWYWFASGYGERVLKGLVVLIGVLLVSAGMYTQVGFTRWKPRIATENDVTYSKRDEVGAPLKFLQALSYSASVMMLQKPEPAPATTAAQSLVLLETFLGPAQAALLFLAIRRKFMR